MLNVSSKIFSKPTKTFSDFFFGVKQSLVKTANKPYVRRVRVSHVSHMFWTFRPIYFQQSRCAIVEEAWEKCSLAAPIPSGFSAPLKFVLR